jgi:DNA-binding response OmpR family regulator
MNEYVVLVVDDEQEIRNGIAIYLKNEGIKVFTAKDGIEAIEILNKEKVHLIILDIMMPRQDGISTTFKIREKKKYPDYYAEC